MPIVLPVAGGVLFLLAFIAIYMAESAAQARRARIHTPAARKPAGVLFWCGKDEQHNPSMFCMELRRSAAAGGPSS